jgi:hypothetical protein
MEIETLKAINEGMYPGLMMILEAIALILGFFAISGIVICLAGITWLCFEETRARVTAPRTARRASLPYSWESTPPAPAPQVRTTFTRGVHTTMPHLQFTSQSSEKPTRRAAPKSALR